jgi:hypothetical protein
MEAKIDLLCKKIDDNDETFHKLSERLIKLECQSDPRYNTDHDYFPHASGSSTGTANVNVHDANAQEDARTSGGYFGPIGALNTNAPEDLTAAFQTISDTVQKVLLPPDFCVKITKQGMNREQQAAINIVTKTAKFSEVTLKCLSRFQPGRVIAEDELERLLTIQVAQTRFLQDEMAALLVQSQFDPTTTCTTKMFRNLQRNSSVFTPNTLSNLERAVTISAACARGGQSHGHERGRFNNFHSNWRGRPYGRGGGYQLLLRLFESLPVSWSQPPTASEQ